MRAAIMPLFVGGGDGCRQGEDIGYRPAEIPTKAS
jgi:hypothetical protein